MEIFSPLSLFWSGSGDSKCDFQQKEEALAVPISLSSMMSSRPLQDLLSLGITLSQHPTAFQQV